MFKELTNLAYKRNGKEAFGFYLAYLLATIALVFLIAVVVALTTGTTSYDAGFRIGETSAIVLVITFSLVVVNAKKSWTFSNILLVLLSGILAFFGGGLLGLVPTAYLTTRDNGKVDDATTSV